MNKQAVSIQETASNIQNIRYCAHDYSKIEFDFCDNIVRIKEPADVLLVGWPGAEVWIATHYSFILAPLIA